MSSNNIFQNLRALENDKLRFPEISFNDRVDNLIIYAHSSLSFKEIDVKIKLALIDFHLTLIEKEENGCFSYCYKGLQFNGRVDYKIEYQMEAKGDLYVPANWVAESQGILEENAIIGEVVHQTPTEELLDKINSGSVPENATVLSKGSYYVPQEQIDKLDKILENSDCPDCSDGFYYPFNGPKEPCKTCGGPTPESCSECNGTNTVLQHPEGTPGPCPSCNDSEIMVHQMRGTDSVILGDSANQRLVKLISQSLHTIWQNVDWNKYPEIRKVDNCGPDSDYVIYESMFIPNDTMHQVILDQLEARVIKHCRQSKARLFTIFEPIFGIELRDDGRLISATIQIKVE